MTIQIKAIRRFFRVGLLVVLRKVGLECPETLRRNHFNESGRGVHSCGTVYYSKRFELRSGSWSCVIVSVYYAVQGFPIYE